MLSVQRVVILIGMLISTVALAAKKDCQPRLVHRGHPHFMDSSDVRQQTQRSSDEDYSGSHQMDAYRNDIPDHREAPHYDEFSRDPYESDHH